LAAGLRPDSLGELKCSPYTLAAMRGLHLREEGRLEREGKGRRGREKRAREGRGVEGRQRQHLLQPC